MFYRVLNSADIPKINAISSQIWDGDDYIPNIVHGWLSEESQKGHFFGVFQDEEKEILLGFGHIRFYSPEIAWIEGGRVNPAYQQQGVGIKMTEYALEYCKEHQFRFVQWDTFTENSGSKKLAQRFGLSEKARMLGFELDISKIDLGEFETISDSGSSNLEIITQQPLGQQNNDVSIVNFLIEHIKPLLPKDAKEFNVGFSFMPLIPSVFQELDFIWIFPPDFSLVCAIILHSSKGATEAPQKDDLWMIIYGKPEHFPSFWKDMTHYLHNCSFFNARSLHLFVDPPLGKFAGDAGWVPFDKIENSGVILFEKEINPLPSP